MSEEMSLFDAAIVLLFTGFAAVAGLLWPKMLNDHVATEAADLQKTFPNIRRADFAKILNEEAAAHRYRDYLVPTIMFVTITLIGTGLIVADNSNIDRFSRYEVLAGDAFVLQGTADESVDVAAPADAAQAAANKRSADIDMVRQVRRAVLMIQCAFLGAFMWSLQYLLRRAQARDIGPTTIYRICLYILFGIILAIFVTHLSEQTESFLGTANFESSLPVVGFITGYFSIEIFERMADTVMRRRAAMKTDERPPSLLVVEGISYDTAARLRELWLDDAYALAQSNPVEIFLKTPFGLEQCIDWTAQAMLLCRTKPALFTFLRAQGVRTILELDALVRTPAEGGGSAYDRFVEDLAFGDGEEDAQRKTALRALGNHMALSLDSDLAFCRLRQLVSLLMPAAAEPHDEPAADEPAPLARAA